MGGEDFDAEQAESFLRALASQFGADSAATDISHEDFPESPRHLGDSQQGTRRIPTGHRSQSEADWAYVKRALARGDDPETVIKRIADYRVQDKADPQYYARHTVTKALTETRGFAVPGPSDSRALVASDTRQEKDH